MTEVEEFLKEFVKADYKSVNGKIDVDGNVNIINYTHPRLPVMFGNVTGEFKVSHSDIESLEGFPIYSSSMTLNGLHKLKSLEGIGKTERIHIVCCSALTTTKYLQSSPRIFLHDCSSLKKLENEKLDVDNYTLWKIPVIDLTGTPEKLEELIVIDCKKLQSLNTTTKEISKVFGVHDTFLRTYAGICKNVKKYDMLINVHQSMSDAEKKIINESEEFAIAWFRSGKTADEFVIEHRGRFAGKKFGF